MVKKIIDYRIEISNRPQVLKNSNAYLSFERLQYLILLSAYLRGLGVANTIDKESERIYLTKNISDGISVLQQLVNTTLDSMPNSPYGARNSLKIAISPFNTNEQYDCFRPENWTIFMNYLLFLQPIEKVERSFVEHVNHEAEHIKTENKLYKGQGPGKIIFLPNPTSSGVTTLPQAYAGACHSDELVAYKTNVLLFIRELERALKASENNKQLDSNKIIKILKSGMVDVSSGYKSLSSISIYIKRAINATKDSMDFDNISDWHLEGFEEYYGFKHITIKNKLTGHKLYITPAITHGRKSIDIILPFYYSPNDKVMSDQSIMFSMAELEQTSHSLSINAEKLYALMDAVYEQEKPIDDLSDNDTALIVELVFDALIPKYSSLLKDINSFHPQLKEISSAVYSDLEAIKKKNSHNLQEYIKDLCASLRKVISIPLLIDSEIIFADKH